MAAAPTPPARMRAVQYDAYDGGAAGLKVSTGALAGRHSFVPPFI